MKHITRSVSSIGASVMAGFILLIASPAGATANGDPPAIPVYCVMESSQVVGGMAVFTVGPSDCNVDLGPVSFSTYALPSGFAKPWAAQQLYAHSPDNGGYYGPGTHQLTASIGDLCNWQTDLYRGTGQHYAPHVHHLHGLNVGWDLAEGNVCDGPVFLQPVSDPGVPGTTPDAPITSQLFGGPGVPQPAAAGHGVFDTRASTGDRPAATLRTAPVIEQTWLNSNAVASSSTFNWLSAAVVLAAMALAFVLTGTGLALRLVGGVLYQRGRPE